MSGKEMENDPFQDEYSDITDRKKTRTNYKLSKNHRSSTAPCSLLVNPSLLRDIKKLAVDLSTTLWQITEESWILKLKESGKLKN